MNEYNLLAQAIKNKLKQNSFDNIFITVKGNSMLPTYKNGDKLKVKRVDRELAIGDVILYSHLKKSFTIHRINNIVKNDYGITTYLTKGDNNPDIDPYIITDQNIIGIIDDFK